MNVRYFDNNSWEITDEKGKKRHTRKNRQIFWWIRYHYNVEPKSAQQIMAEAKEHPYPFDTEFFPFYAEIVRYNGRWEALSKEDGWQPIPCTIKQHLRWHTDLDTAGRNRFIEYMKNIADRV